MVAPRRKSVGAKTVVKQSSEPVVEEAKRLNNLAASVEVAEGKMTVPENAKEIAEKIAKSAPGIPIATTGGFINAPKVLPSKDGRSYAGNASRLMNALYDATETPTLYLLPGWERIALIVSKACERLEKVGWRRGR